MPWRGIRDPYRIWLSEVMLQQTQVATATPYYQSFVRRFPTLRSLARASEDRVLAAWAGLGYYRRARHLHEAARLIVRDHAGIVPSDADTFGRLPGVGRYTTGAVLSIAFDRPLPALDGNVARVLSRLVARPWSVRDPRGARALWAVAGSLVPAKAPGDWNQAVMELGAVVCTPRAPRCGECPIAASCRAHALGQETRFPPAPARRQVERVRRALAIVEHQGRVLVAQRREPPLEGLWEPPGVDVAEGNGAPRVSLERSLEALGVRVRLTDTGIVLRHRITHREIDVELWRGAPRRAPRDLAGRGLRWEDARRPRVAHTAIARRAIDALRAASPGTAGRRRSTRRA
jgi:A/G-specific adenine glycosylase